MITKEAIEALRKSLNGVAYISVAEATDALVAALAAMPGPAVQVRELVWSGGNGNYPEWRADGFGFKASIDKSRASLFGEFPLFINGEWDHQKHNTLESAKAAAQADYEARILSAITPAPDLASENERLRKMLAGCDWYWPEDDTSSSACADGQWQIAENCDVKQGEVFGYSRGGVVETRYYGFLEAAADAGSDDQFEADEPTREAAETKISAELNRRAALERT